MARGATTQRVVGFAPTVQSIRQPRDDERYVMSQFVKHANKCSHCRDPYQAYRDDTPLCSRGTDLAKDVTKYLYAKGDKPFSLIDRQSNERTQVQVPAGMEAVSLLIKAIGKGMVLSRKAVVVTPEKVEVEKVDPISYYSTRLEPVKVVRRKEYAEERRDNDRNFDVIEVVPRRREQQEKVYHSTRIEDRSRHERRERPKSVIYPEEGKGSLYEQDQAEKRRRRRYDLEPIVIVAEPRRERERYSILR